MPPKLFHAESPRAIRPAKTDRLILKRELNQVAQDKRLERSVLEASHAVLVHWADLESSGKLERIKEEQLQGEFLADIFGKALHYVGHLSGTDTWNYVQHPKLNNQTPDAALGFFTESGADFRAVIELKGPLVDLDYHRSAGRTAVDQCWDYLVNTPPTCRWGIVSNIVSFRLYERDSTKRAYEHFTLQSLRDFETFREFYALFERDGLIVAKFYNEPRAKYLLRRTRERQREVSDKLYDAYSQRRGELIRELRHKYGHSVEDAIEMAQRLFDRIIFVAFCEDRGLLPPRIIDKAYKVGGLHTVTNPRWQSFKALFRFVNEGNHNSAIPAYNGGLFAPHPVDDLELPDEWTEFFRQVGDYDFADEVNLEVLGHLFERSITELEKLKHTGMFFGDAEKAERYAAMPQSAKRKRLGVYYTPAELTSRIVQYTVDEWIAQRFADLAATYGIAREDADRGAVPDDPAYWQDCLDILRRLKIVDPACGSGAFLFQAYDVLEARYREVIGHLETPPPPPKPVPRIKELTDEEENAILREKFEEWVKLNRQRKTFTLAELDELDEKLERQKRKRKKARAPQLPILEEEPPRPETLHDKIPEFILNDNLFGVDLSPEAVEITQLALWIRSASPGRTLAKLSDNIVHGNSLVHDPEVHGAGFDWKTRFPQVFDREEAGFDCVVGNPPWERMKLQEREFFSLPAPEIATATNAATRRRLVGKLAKAEPELFERYQIAQREAETLLTYCRTSDAYPLTGRGDINTYAVFAELANQLVAPHGRVGLLVPSGIASDKTTKDFFGELAGNNRLVRLYDFENKRVFFPEVHASFKFSILNFGGKAATTDAADFVFFIHDADEIDDPKRHVALTSKDIELLNPNTRTCPIFRCQRDAKITKAIYRRVPVLIDRRRKGPTRNPWGVSFRRMFDQTNDAELFHEANALKSKGFKLDGNRWTKGKQTLLPVYEAKMLQAFDHRAADVITARNNWVRQGQTARTTRVDHANPEHTSMPRFWIEQSHVEEHVGKDVMHFLCFKDVTSPTNQRTMIATFTPVAAVVNSAPIILTEQAPQLQACLLGNLNAFAYDFVVRQKISNVHLNFFIVEQIPTLPPDAYAKPCPWQHGETLETWISERALKLTCTAEDMLPLADACGFTSGSFQKEYGGRLNKWDEEERAVLMAQLDAAYFHLYGINRDDAEYILSTFKGIHDTKSLFPGQATTAQFIVEKYDELAAAMALPQKGATAARKTAAKPK